MALLPSPFVATPYPVAPDSMPAYLRQPDRWDATDQSNRQPHESDAMWQARALAAARHWAAEDERAATAGAGKADAKREANRLAQQRFRDKHKVQPSAEATAAHAHLAALQAQRAALTAQVRALDVQILEARLTLAKQTA
jgi:hypothetical protein